MHLLSDEYKWEKKLFDEGFHDKNLLLAEKYNLPHWNKCTQQSKVKSFLK